MSNVDNFFDQAGSGSDNTLNLNGSIISNKNTLSLVATLTLAEINAGIVILAGVAGKTITPLDFKAKVNGTFASTTSVDVQDTNSSAVAIATIAVAGLTDGSIINEVDGDIVMGAGYLGALTAGEGIEVVNNGATATGGTSITFKIDYKIEG